jgi:DNA-binding HxlR family transcriptional regulator
LLTESLLARTEDTIGRSLYASDRLEAVKRTGLGHHRCSIARTLDMVGEWWSPLILRDIAHGIRRFREIQADLDISANVLSDRLETLVREGLLETRLYQSRPERHEYYLTEKGLDLVPVLLALLRWGDRWTWPGRRGPVQVVHDECGAEVDIEALCPHCGRAVRPTELRAQPRDGSAVGLDPGQPGSALGNRLRAVPGGVRLGQ